MVSQRLIEKHTKQNKKHYNGLRKILVLWLLYIIYDKTEMGNRLLDSFS